MTPPAATAAARAPKVARRYSGPTRSGPARSGPARSRLAVAPARPAFTHVPRARPAKARQPSRAHSRALPVRILSAVWNMPLLDRLIRSRYWIAVIAVGLVGIVGMQLYVLELNAGIGRSIQRVTALQRDNAQLEADVSSLSSGDRIEAAAQSMGMVIAPVGGTRFLTAGGTDSFRARRRLARADAAAPASAAPPMATAGAP